MAHSNSETDASQEWTGNAALPPGIDFLQPSTHPGSIGRLAHYEVFKILGRGSYGIVLKGLDTKLQRDVAIKMLSFEFGPTSTAHARFVREARAAATINHENVVQIYAVEDLPKAYLVMEYVPGETLQDKLDRDSRMSVPDVLTIGAQVARGLAAAHEKGLIHRDLKPGNILIRKVGDDYQAKLADFGLALSASDARLTQSGMVAGTPLFMAPEQARGEPLDHRTDLFSLGSVLYVLTTGSVPFGATDGVAVMNRIAWGEPVPIRKLALNTPPWLCDVIAKLHARKPADRYQSAKDVADVLTRALTNPPPDRTAVQRTRRRWLIGGGLAAAVAGGAAAAVFLLPPEPAPQPTAGPGPTVAPPGRELAPPPVARPESIAALFASTDHEWSKPENLGRGVNANGRDLSVSLTDDERFIVFSQGPPRKLGKLVQSRRPNPQAEFPPATPVSDSIHQLALESAFLSGDGRRLVFIGKRDNAEGVWEATRANVTVDFEEPQEHKLLYPQAARRQPLLSADGCTLFLTATRANSMGEIVAFRRPSPDQPFQQGVPLPPSVNIPGTYNIAAWLSPDGAVLVVTQTVETKAITRYHVRGPDGVFGPSVRLKPFGGAISVGRPWFTPDGRTMYFHSHELGGEGDVDLFVSRLEPKKK